MSASKTQNSTKQKGSSGKVKARLHRRNKHRTRYNFQILTDACPDLKPHITVNKYGDESVDFFDPIVVKLLNTALLKSGYNISEWSIPEDYLCPPIPGRADYIHHIADLISTVDLSSDTRHIPTGASVKCMDIGVGANCIYPIIGRAEYGWSFIGTEIDPTAAAAANDIVQANQNLKDRVKIRVQKKSKDIFYGAIKKGERFDLTICNPPFHASLEEAKKGSIRKLSNLKGKRVKTPVLNFGGQTTELWTEGGEERFIRDMIIQSKQFAESVYCFSTLVSKKSHLKSVFASLKKIRAVKVKTIPMGQGNKSSRLVTWTFLTKKQQELWRSTHWKEMKEFPLED